MNHTLKTGQFVLSSLLTLITTQEMILDNKLLYWKMLLLLKT